MTDPGFPLRVRHRTGGSSPFDILPRWTRAKGSTCGLSMENHVGLPARPVRETAGSVRVEFECGCRATVASWHVTGRHP